MTVQAPAVVDPARAAELTSAARDWPALGLTRAQLSDLELLLLGAFGPVPGYPEDTLRDGLRVPTLLVPVEQAAGLRQGDAVSLRDPLGEVAAVLRVSRVRRAGEPATAGHAPPRGRAQLVGPDDGIAPDDVSVPEGQARVTGRVEGLQLPTHRDYPHLWLRPGELRARLWDRGWQPGPAPWAVWADGLLHTADIARIRALTRQGKRCVVLAPAGGADPDDHRYHLRVRALRAALDALDEPVRATEATLMRADLAAEAVGARPASAEGPASHPPITAQPRHALLVLVPVAPSPELAAPHEPGITGTPTRGAVSDEDPREVDRAAELAALRAHLAEFYGLGGSLTGPAIGAPERAQLAALLASGRHIPEELTPPGVAAELLRAHAEGWLLG